jgi:hypothetical protein
MVKARVSQPSSIDRLPEPVRERIAQLRRAGRTIDEILDHLKTLDVEVSRSALGRHVKTFAEVADEMRRANAMSKFIIDEFGEETDERVGRANMRILQGALMQLLTERPLDEEGQAISLDPEEAKSISLSLQRLISAQRMDADRQMKIRAQAKAEAKEEAAKAVETVAKRTPGGLTKDTVQAIRREILGIKE